MTKFKECYSGMWLVGGVVAKGVFERGVPEPSRISGGSNWEDWMVLLYIAASLTPSRDFPIIHTMTLTVENSSGGLGTTRAHR
jgi:hypothetical protein